MDTTNHAPFSASTRTLVKDSILAHYRVIEKTTDADQLKTAFARLISEMDEITNRLDKKQSRALGKAMESSAFMISQGTTLTLAKEWIVGQLEDNVFEGYDSEFVD